MRGSERYSPAQEGPNERALRAVARLSRALPVLHPRLDVTHRRSLTTRLTGSLPSEDQWRSAEAAVAAEEHSCAGTQGLGWILTQLVGGRFQQVAAVDIGVEGVAIHHTATSWGAEPPRSLRTPWNDLLAVVGAPTLPLDAIRRLFLLAGGEEHVDGGSHPVNAEHLARALVTRLRPMVREDTPRVFVIRCVGWSLLERACALARSSLLPVAEVRLPAGSQRSFRQMAAAVPLRRSLWLAVAHPRPDGTVVPELIPLFRAGTRLPGEGDPHPVEAVRLVTPPGHDRAGGALVLPVLEAEAGTPEHLWRPVRMDRLRLREASAVTARYELHAPGRVTVQCAGLDGSEDRSWQELLASLPRHPDPARTVDLVCAVEIAERPGSAKVFEGRLQDVSAVAAEVEALLDRPGSLQVGLIGYGDHDFTAGASYRNPVVHRLALCPVEEVRAALAAWEPTVERHDFAAPWEHVPEELDTWRWRAGSRRVLLTVGSRPPHPPGSAPRARRASASVRRCPRRVDWQGKLAGLLQRDGLVRLAVLDEPSWMDRVHGEGPLAAWAHRAWGELGADGLFSTGEAPSRVAQAVAGPAGTRPANGARIELAMPAPDVLDRSG